MNWSKKFAWLAVAFGVLWLFSASISVVPELEAANSRFCLLMLILSLTAASLSAVFAGVARARDRWPIRSIQSSTLRSTTNGKMAMVLRKSTRNCLWKMALCLLPLIGAGFLSVGHMYYVMAKGRESQQNIYLERDGHYENPYWERQTICDFLGMACIGGWGLWCWLSFLGKCAELASSHVLSKRKGRDAHIPVFPGGS